MRTLLLRSRSLLDYWLLLSCCIVSAQAISAALDRCALSALSVFGLSAGNERSLVLLRSLLLVLRCARPSRQMSEPFTSHARMQQLSACLALVASEIRSTIPHAAQAAQHRGTGLRRSSALAVPSPSARPRFPQSTVTGINRSVPNASGPQGSSLAMGLAYPKNLHNECPDVVMRATLSSVRIITCTSVWVR